MRGIVGKERIGKEMDICPLIAEATRAMNETSNKFIAIMGNQDKKCRTPSAGLPTTCNYHSAGVTTLHSQTGHPQSL
jgi:hypothetical protein